MPLNSDPDAPLRGETAMTVAIVMVAIHNLVSEDQSRLEHDEDHINALAADFQQRMRDNPGEHPVTNPLRVLRRGDTFVIVAGTHRYLAALRVGIRDLPCIVLPADLDDASLFIEAVKDNRLHKPYTPIEDARNILRVQELRGCSQAAAGRLIGIPNPSDVTKLLRILRGYPEDLFPLIGEGDGKIPFTTAYALAQLADEQQKRELTEKVLRGLLTRDAAEEEVRRLLHRAVRRCGDRQRNVTVELPGLKAIFSVGETAKARALLAQLDAAATKLEKNKLPFQSLPQMFS